MRALSRVDPGQANHTAISVSLANFVAEKDAPAIGELMVIRTPTVNRYGRALINSDSCLSTVDMVVSSPYHCLILSLLVFPLLLLATYFIAAFPGPPEPVHVNPSLASLPRTEKSWLIYPEDFYPDGGYAEFPNGKVRLTTFCAILCVFRCIPLG